MAWSRCGREVTAAGVADGHIAGGRIEDILDHRAVGAIHPANAGPELPSDRAVVPERELVEVLSLEIRTWRTARRAACEGRDGVTASRVRPRVVIETQLGKAPEVDIVGGHEVHQDLLVEACKG